MNRLHLSGLAIVFVALLAGCGQQEPDCKNPRNKEEKQQCALKEATGARITPTEKPKRAQARWRHRWSEE